MKISKVIGLALGIACASPVFAQQVELSPQQVFGLSQQALRDGQPAAAAAGANALLAQNPDSVPALILRAEAAILQRDFQTAVNVAQRGFFASNTAQTSYATARLAALAHAELQQDTRAQVWLRLASQYAPNAAATTSIAEDYRFLSNRNPWSTNLRFGITPSSNINNGSASDTVRLFGLPFDFELDGEARALSGLEISGGFTTTYRLRASDTSATFVAVDANARTYTLSAQAQEQAPDANGSDFSDASLSFGLTHRYIGRPGDQPSSFRFSVGQNWYSGDPYTQFAEVSGSHAWLLSPADRVTASVTVQRTVGLQSQDPVDSFGINTGWTHAFASGDQTTFSLGWRQSQSETVDSDYTSYQVSGNYSLAEPVFGVNFGFGLTLEQREFDATRYDPGNPRTDQTATANVRAVFSEVEYYGFRPVVTFAATRTSSTVDLFDRDYLRLGFDLQSSF